MWTAETLGMKLSELKRAFPDAWAVQALHDDLLQQITVREYVEATVSFCEQVLKLRSGSVGTLDRYLLECHHLMWYHFPTRGTVVVQVSHCSHACCVSRTNIMVLVTCMYV